MSMHPKTYFGPAVICPSIFRKEEFELQACFNEACRKHKTSVSRGKYCDECGKMIETRTYEDEERISPHEIIEENDLDFETAHWCEDKQDDYYIGKGICNYYPDVEEVVGNFSLDALERVLEEFKIRYAGDIAKLNEIYSGQVKIELVLLNWIS